MAIRNGKLTELIKINGNNEKIMEIDGINPNIQKSSNRNNIAATMNHRVNGYLMTLQNLTFTVAAGKKGSSNTR